MAAERNPEALYAVPGSGWSVCVQERRLVFRDGASVLEVPVEGPLRWARDGEEVSFDHALAAAPPELHGWMALAALIGLRRTLGGLLVGVALPPGYHEWPRMARRARPLAAWMECLARLDAVDVPDAPATVDDGLDELGDVRAA
jgi:hypothetical protein